MASLLELEQQLAIAQTALRAAEAAYAQDPDPETADFIRRQKQFISELLTQIADARQNSGQISAGDVVDGAQAARDDAVNTQIPELVLEPLGRVTAATNAVSAEAVGVVRDLIPDSQRALDQLQGLPNKSIAQLRALTPVRVPPVAQIPIVTADSSGFAGTQAGGSAGAASAPEDSAGLAGADSGGTNSVQTAVDTKFDTRITAQPNVLDRYASYTYSISIYIMSPSEYRELISSKTRVVPSQRLLIQSGGIAGADRNQRFPLDYYIDDVEMKSVITGKGTGGAHNITTMTFKIVETNGITLIQNLRDAAADLAEDQVLVTGDTSQTPRTNNYSCQNYLMVIRFYGYDETGTLVRPANSASVTDRNAIVEKFIPFQFTNIKFRIENRAVEYQCEAVAPQNGIATGQGRGVIPTNIQLTSGKLRDLLTVKLADMLNKYQRDLVKAGTVTVADEYEIVLVEPELQEAGIVPPGPPAKNKTPMTQPTTAKEAKDGQTQTVDSRQRTRSAAAGSSITQFIDLAVRNSDYLFQQQTKIKVRDRDGSEKEVPQGPGARSFGWFRIGTEITPIGDRIDPKRNDFAYRIRYVVSMYGITEMNSEYFPKGKYRGEHKRYNYWFTGENNSVLRFEQDFNYLYYQSATGGTTGDGNNTSETARRVPSPNSAQSNQGDDDNVLEPVANAADFLYSPADQARVEMEIVGDPAWIQQGELWSGAADPPSYEPFLTDGTINFEARDAVFLVTWRQPADYNINTGVMELT